MRRALPVRILRELVDAGGVSPMRDESTDRRRDVGHVNPPLVAKNRADHIDVIEHPYMWYYVAIPA
jgi:hypothetical protein